MRQTKYIVKPTSQFRKDYKLVLKRGLNVTLLEDVVAALAMGKNYRRSTKIMACPEIGAAIGSAISFRTGS